MNDLHTEAGRERVRRVFAAFLPAILGAALLALAPPAPARGQGDVASADEKSEAQKIDDIDQRIRILERKKELEDEAAAEKAKAAAEAATAAGEWLGDDGGAPRQGADLWLGLGGGGGLVVAHRALLLRAAGPVEVGLGYGNSPLVSFRCQYVSFRLKRNRTKRN